MDGVTQSPADALRWALEQVQSVCQTEAARRMLTAADERMRDITGNTTESRAWRALADLAREMGK